MLAQEHLDAAQLGRELAPRHRQTPPQSEPASGGSWAYEQYPLLARPKEERAFGVEPVESTSVFSSSIFLSFTTAPPCCTRRARFALGRDQAREDEKVEHADSRRRSRRGRVFEGTELGVARASAEGGLRGGQRPVGLALSMDQGGRLPRRGAPWTR